MRRCRIWVVTAHDQIRRGVILLLHHAVDLVLQQLVHGVVLALLGLGADLAGGAVRCRVRLELLVGVVVVLNFDGSYIPYYLSGKPGFLVKRSKAE